MNPRELLFNWRVPTLRCGVDNAWIREFSGKSCSHPPSLKHTHTHTHTYPTRMHAQQCPATSSIVLSRATDQKKDLFSSETASYALEISWRNRTHCDFVFPFPDSNAPSDTPHSITVTIEQTPLTDKAKGLQEKNFDNCICKLYFHTEMCLNRVSTPC